MQDLFVPYVAKLLILTIEMRRNCCNARSSQDRLPILFFFIVGVVLILLIQFQSIPLPEVNAWNFNQFITQKRYTSSTLVTTKRSVQPLGFIRMSLQNTDDKEDPEKMEMNRLFYDLSTKLQRTTTFIAIGSAIFCSTLSLTGTTVQPPSANAYEDYISEPVQIAIKAVQDANSNDALVKAYENIAEIITEGKGVGGSINFQGVQLDRGYVSDEDTSIYNPGLTLLTETEKTRLVDTVVESKKQQLIKSGSNADNNGGWNNDLEAGYSFLRERLDPLHMYELRGYLSILPIYGAVLYLVALAVQQLARDAFPVAYIVCAAAVFAPIIVLVLVGPQ